jgi:hypothetical protein
VGRPEPLEYFDAVAGGELHVQQDDVWMLRLDSCHAGLAVVSRQNLDSVGSERRPHQPATGLVVVDYQERPAHESLATLW